MKRMLCVLMALAVALCAFATGGPESASGSSGSASTDKLKLSEYPDVMKVNFAFYVGTASPPDPANNPTVAYIRDKYKIDLSGSLFLAGEDAAAKMSLMVASKDMPDGVNFWTAPVMTDLMHQFSDAGMTVETEPLFKYLPNITPNYTKTIIDINRSPKDGKLYCVPSFTVNPDNKKVNYTIEPNLDFVVRKDLMDKLGKTYPKTMDDFYQLLQAFKGLPDVNGKKVIPYEPLLGFDDFEWLLGAGFGIWKHRKEMNVAEKRRVHMYETRDYLEFLKYAAKLYREGLVDPELSTLSYDKCYERVGEGRVGVYVDWPNNIDMNNIAVQKNIPTARYEAISVPRVPGLGNTEYWPVTTLGACTTLISKKFKDPVRMAKLFDWMFTTEGWSTVAWGAPGKKDGPWYEENGQYFWNKDVYNAELKKNPSYSGHRGGWVYFMVGQFVYLPEHIGLKAEGGTDPDRLLAKERNIAEIWMDQEYELWEAIPMGPVETQKGTAISAIFTTMRQQIVMESKTDADVVAGYNKMMDEAKKAGLIAMLQEQYQLIQDYNAKKK